jgi:predicted RNA binding protein with dsRBD fold (UPF0201 family)
MELITVHIEADVNPTESEEKIKKATCNLFGDLHTELKPAAKGSVLTAEVHGQDALGTLRNILRRDRIRDASRRALRQSLHGNTLVFCINKQVAFAGHVSFCAAESESPLGPIRVKIQTSEPLQLIDWLAPKTNKP